MSEEAVAEAPVAGAEAPAEAPSVAVDENGIPAVINEDFGRMAYAKVLENSNQVLAMTAEINAVTGKGSELKDSLRASFGSDSDATDEDKKIQATIDKANEVLLEAETKRDAKIDAKIAKITENASETILPLTEKRDELLKATKGARTYLASTYGDDALFGLPKITGGGSTTSGATGQTRMRGLNVYVSGKLCTQKDGKGVEKSSLSAGAKAAKVETSAMQQAFVAAQGTKDRDNFKPEVTFDIVGSDNVTYPVKVTLKDS